jgi:hypothetical protein
MFMFIFVFLLYSLSFRAAGEESRHSVTGFFTSRYRLAAFSAYSRAAGTLHLLRMTG